MLLFASAYNMVMMTMFGMLECWRIERDLLIQNLLLHAVMLRQFRLYIAYFITYVYYIVIAFE